ncbi:hypothetical protein D3C75_1168870 [compost metagenome]
MMDVQILEHKMAVHLGIAPGAAAAVHMDAPADSLGGGVVGNLQIPDLPLLLVVEVDSSGCTRSGNQRLAAGAVHVDGDGLALHP